MKFLLLCCFLVFISNLHAIDVTCELKIVRSDYFSSTFDQCDAKLPNITERVTIKALAFKNLGRNKTYDYINNFRVSEQRVEYFPCGIKKFFQNLEFIEVSWSDLREIRQRDLKPFGKLKYLTLHNNRLEYIEENVFEHNPKLQHVSFEGNKVFYVALSVFDDLNELKSLMLQENFCINDFAEKDKGKVLDLIKSVNKKCRHPSTLLHVAKESLQSQIMEIHASNKKLESEIQKYDEISMKNEQLKSEVLSLKMNISLIQNEKITASSDEYIFLILIIFSISVCGLAGISLILLVACQCREGKDDEEGEEDSVNAFSNSETQHEN